MVVVVVVVVDGWNGKKKHLIGNKKGKKIDELCQYWNKLAMKANWKVFFLFETQQNEQTLQPDQFEIFTWKQKKSEASQFDCSIHHEIDVGCIPEKQS